MVTMVTPRDRSDTCLGIFEESEVFCVLPWLHLCGSIDGVWGRCCVDSSICHDGYYTRTVRPPMPLAAAALGCIAGSPVAQDNQDRVFGLLAAFNGPNLRRTRLAMLRNERVEACSYCYAREAHGGISYRQNMNRIFRERWDWGTLIAETGGDGTLSRKPVFLDLRMGNQCNLHCIMCCYPVSSNWKQHVETATWLSGLLDPYWGDDDFWREVRESLPTMQRIYFAGGEPMLQASHHRLLDIMLEMGVAGGIELVYNTNLTYLPPGILERFSHFRSVEVGASCDGMGVTFEMIRRGASWESFVRNLRIVAPHVQLRLAVTPQRDNVGNLPELVGWALREGYDVDLLNILQFPKELSLANLSPAEKARHAPEFANLAARCREMGQPRLADEVERIAHILMVE
jgi:MoaA/NifB/PqqE/SkfB family radical SAM enzyme